MQQCIPTMTVRLKNSPPWLSHDILQAIYLLGQKVQLQVSVSLKIGQCNETNWCVNACMLMPCSANS